MRVDSGAVRVVRMIKNKKRGGRALAPDEVRARVSALGGVAHQRLARRYGVSQSTATRAINGDTHADVPHALENDYGPEGWALGLPRFFDYADAVARLNEVEGDVDVVEEVAAPRVSVSTMIEVLRELDALDERR